MSFQTWSKPKAKNQHTCDECHGVIVIGETYSRFSGMIDGDLYAWKACCDCDDMRNDINGDIYEPVPFGGLQEHLSDTDDIENIKKMLETIQRRNGKSTDWMKEKFDELA